MGISISMLYGVSQQAIAYPYEVPPEAHGNALLVATEQISLTGKVQIPSAYSNYLSEKGVLITRIDSVGISHAAPSCLGVCEAELPLFL